ncbi:hypothetical protein B0H14DRAFT_962263 [Mycena olivaceomarginata]|nr:hypothetical protein B0H14DRAFT_962263 [Mycena olivaceomarginata]
MRRSNGCCTLSPSRPPSSTASLRTSRTQAVALLGAANKPMPSWANNANKYLHSAPHTPLQIRPWLNGDAQFPVFATFRPSAVIAAFSAPRARLLPPQHPGTVCPLRVPSAVVRRCTSLRVVQCRLAVYLLILLAPFCSPLVDTVTFISASRVVF